MMCEREKYNSPERRKKMIKDKFFAGDIFRKSSEKGDLGKRMWYLSPKVSPNIKMRNVNTFPFILIHAVAF